MRQPTYTIIGAGLGGAVAASTLRKEGFDGRILLIGEEPEFPYTKPPLSKEVIRGEQQPDQIRFHEAAWYEDQSVELVLGARAAGIDPSSRTVEFASGRRVGYDKLLIATGGHPRNLGVPGSGLDGVCTLRNLSDARRIRPFLERRDPIVVVGAGFIGAEVAASARAMGCEVTIVELADVPLGRVLGSQLGSIYAEIHREHGVDLRTGLGIERIEGDGVVERVVTTDGRAHEAALVVVGIGIEPAVEVARSGGLRTSDGIVVDECCASSVPDVYAVGDVALHPNPMLPRPMRIEQWQNAQHQAVAAAANMLGRVTPFSEVPWFWSDQYDLNLQMAGIPSPGARVVFRGDVASRGFSVFYVQDDVVEAVLGVNRVRDVRTGRRMIESRSVVSAVALADESTDLAGLVPERVPSASGPGLRAIREGTEGTDL